MISIGWLALMVASLAVAHARPTFAGEGRAEINQVRALAGGVGPLDTADFPVTLSASGSYVLTSDLVVADPSKTAIEITASGPVSIDLNGFALRGPVTCTGQGSTLACTGGTGYGVRSHTETQQPLVVENGRIEGFSGAVSVKGGCLLSGLTLLNGGVAVYGDSVAGVDSPCIIRDTTIKRVPGTAAVWLDTASALVADNVIEGSLSRGVFHFRNGKGAISLFRNSIQWNGAQGVEANAQVLMLDNVVRQNAAQGLLIHLTESVWPSLLIGNSFFENGATGAGAAQIEFQNTGYTCETGSAFTNNVITRGAVGDHVVGCTNFQMAPNVCGSLGCF